MSTSWYLHEVGELGKEGKRWELQTHTALSVGTNASSNVQFSSPTVEDQHAVLEWNQKSVSFLVRDLGTVNGTYVNNRPLRRGSSVLRHGDSIRFGYEKTRLFRIEESFKTQAPPTSQPPSTSISATTHVTTQTSPQEQQKTDTSDVTKATHPEQEQLFTTTQLPPAPGVQYVSMPAQAIVMANGIHTQQIPVLIPQAGSVQYGFPQSPALSPMTPHLQSILPGHTHQMTTPPMSPVSLWQQQLATPTSSSATPASSTYDVDSEGESVLEGSLPRNDGRRCVDKESSTPSLHKASQLYGQPSWWGDEGEGTKPEHKLHFVQPGSQILRDTDHRGSDEAKPSSSMRLSSKDELRMQAISNSSLSQESLTASNSSWVVDFQGGSLASAAKMRTSRLSHSRRPRSADPSPNRLTPRCEGSSTSPNVSPKHSPVHTAGINTKLRSMSLQTQSVPSSPRKASSSVGKKMDYTKRAVTPPPSRKRASTPPVTRRAATPPVSSSTSANKPPLSAGASARSKSISVTKGKTTGTPKSRHSYHGRESTTNSVSKSKSTAPSNSSSGEVKGQNKTIKDQNQEKKGQSKEVKVHNKTIIKKKKGDIQNETYITGVSQSSNDISSESLSSSLSEQTLSTATATGDGKVAHSLKSASEGCVVGVAKEGTADSGAEGSRPNSARKQWTNEEGQVPDSLMLASMEARMRRLSKMAQGAAIQVSSLKRILEEGRAVVIKEPDIRTIRLSSPVATRAEQHLPEWRFVNKEADSIFRSIRVVERWLQDIDTTVSCIQLPSDSPNEGGTPEEGVDFEEPPNDGDIPVGVEFEDHTPAEGSDFEELFEDSIEDILSGSDNDA